MANALQAVLDRAKEKARRKLPSLSGCCPAAPSQGANGAPEEFAERPEREGLPNPSARARGQTVRGAISTPK